MESNEEKRLWRIQWMQEEHHCCRLTELKEETEFDYLDGELWFSKELKSRQLDFKITLVASDSLKTYKNLSNGNLANLRIHPNLLYITRYDDMRKSGEYQPRRLFDQESRIPLWRIELRIVDGCVDWWTESEAQPGGYYQHIYNMDKDEEGNWMLPLQMLRVIVVVPMQRTNATGLKIREALQSRRSMYEEIDEDQWEKLVREMERFYKKDGKTEMDRFCLQFDCTLDPGSLMQTRLPTILSEPIINSKNKTCSNFDLHGSISHEKSCTQFQRTTHLFLKLGPPVLVQNAALQQSVIGSGGSLQFGGNMCTSQQQADNVSVRFVTRHKHGQEYSIDKRLNQPVDIRVESSWIEFETPVQHDHVVRDIYKNNREIYLEGYRPKDRHRTKTKVKFHYQTHNDFEDDNNEVDEDNSFCIFCSSNPDKIGLELLSDNSSAGSGSTTGSFSPSLAAKRPRRRNSSKQSRVSNGDVNGGTDGGVGDGDSGHHVVWDDVDASDTMSTSSRGSRQSVPVPRYNHGSLVSLEEEEKIKAINEKPSLFPTSKPSHNNNGEAKINGRDLVNGNQKPTSKQSSNLLPCNSASPQFLPKVSSSTLPQKFEPTLTPSPPPRPTNPNTLSFCTFILVPVAFILGLCLFHQDFPPVWDVMQMVWRVLVYMGTLPLFYRLFYDGLDLTQSAATVMAFAACFTFMQLVQFVF